MSIDNAELWSNIPKILSNRPAIEFLGADTRFRPYQLRNLKERFENQLCESPRLKKC